MLLAIFRDLVSKNRLFLFLTSLAFALYYHVVGGKIFYELSSLVDQYGYCYCSINLSIALFLLFDGQGPGLLPTSFVSQSFQRVFSDGNLSSQVTRARAVIDPLFRSQVRPATIL